jgi:hypothetical protein
VYEFSVVSEVAVRELHKDILNLMDKYIEDKLVIRLVGVNLKKPTSNVTYLTSTSIELDSQPIKFDTVKLQPEIEDIPTVEEESDVLEGEDEEGVDDDD